MSRATTGSEPGSDDRPDGVDDGSAALRMRLRSDVFQSATNPIVIEDVDGTIIDLNSAAESTYGWSREELLGKPVEVLIAPADRSRWRPARVRCLEGEQLGGSLWRQITKAGDELPIVRSLFRLTGGGGEVKALASIGMDVVELQKRVELRERLARAEQRAEERERRELARDLHDSVAQLLAVLRIRIGELIDLADHAPAEQGEDVPGMLRALAVLTEEIDNRVRTVMFRVAPVTLHEFGLVAGLEELAEIVTQTFRLEIAVVERDAPPPLADEVLAALFRGARELLINVARHARTDRARLVITSEGGRASVCVEDDGVGFDPDGAFAGFGLLGLRERLQQFGGRLRLESVPGDGTRACMLVPAAGGPEIAPETR